MDSKTALRKTQPYVVAVTVVAVAATLRLWPLYGLGSRLAWLTFYPATVVAALYGGLGAGLLASLLSCLMVLFALPAVTGQAFVRDATDWLGVAVFLVTCVIIAGVAEGMYRARAREHQADIDRERFFALSLDLLCIASSDGHFKRLNPAWTHTLGWSVEELLAHPFLDWVHPDDREATLREVERQVVAGQPVLKFDNRYRHKDGSWRVLSWKSTPYPGGFMYATARDVTAQRQIEEALVQAKQAAEHANEELESFSYSVAHDLRAPLRSIDGFSQALVEDYGDRLDESGKAYLGRVRAATRQMGQLIDDLLHLARVTAAELRQERVDLSALARSVSSELRRREPERVVEFTCAEGVVVQGDARLLRLALENLIGNAWKFTGKQPRAHIEFGTAAPGGRTTCFIRDNGAGFDMAYAAKLFGAFQRLHSDNEFPGTGIGLATVRRIIQRHGGEVWAEGAVGRGATVYFTL